MSWVIVDCEARGGAPCVGRLTWFGAVEYKSGESYSGLIINCRPSAGNPAVPEECESVSDEAYRGRSLEVFRAFDAWLLRVSGRRSVMWSDNPAFDFQWINDGFWRHLGRNPFGHSARRISDFYAGVTRDVSNTQRWKGWRVTPHDHNPVNDARGNVEALRTILDKMKAGEL